VRPAAAAAAASAKFVSEAMHAEHMTGRRLTQYAPPLPPMSTIAHSKGPLMLTLFVAALLYEHPPPTPSCPLLSHLQCCAPQDSANRSTVGTQSRGLLMPTHTNLAAISAHHHHPTVYVILTSPTDVSSPSVLFAPLSTSAHSAGPLMPTLLHGQSWQALISMQPNPSFV
jgi:hypothetical protein